MDNQEAIETIRLAQSQIEWDYPMDYATAFDMAISALQAQDAPDTNVGDMIYRQAAIDALDVLCQEHRYRIPGKRETYSQYNEAWQDALDSAERAIFDLPSAQPEQSEMIKDIRKWINSGNRGNADYFIVDKIEEIINKYERRYNQPTGGD